MWTAMPNMKTSGRFCTMGQKRSTILDSNTACPVVNAVNRNKFINSLSYPWPACAKSAKLFEF